MPDSVMIEKDEYKEKEEESTYSTNISKDFIFLNYNIFLKLIRKTHVA